MNFRMFPVVFAVLIALSVGVTTASAQDSGSALGQAVLDQEAGEGLVRLEQVHGGSLLFFTDEPGRYVQAPVIQTNIDVSVAGPIARAVVTQRFRNPAPVFVEGKYVFPLPDGAAVDTLKMRVGDRLIEGEIKEREEAKQIYETAKAEGYVASLVEQERPNVFTTSVANIGPNETIVIQIEYQETLSPRDGVYGLRTPLVVAPRYTPDASPVTVVLGEDGWREQAARQRARIGLGRAGGLQRQEDPSLTAAPVADPRTEEPGTIRNPVEMTVTLDAGFPLGFVNSLYHEVDVTRDGEDEATISLTGPVPADRDFYLAWAPARLDDSVVTLFGADSEEAADDSHYLFMITPPAAEAIEEERKPRDVILVQDVSGSMFGESIEQARRGLEMALRRLRPEDRFNIIVFNDDFGVYSEEMVEATGQNVREAIAAVRGLQADGGTEMLPALEAALLDATPNDDSRLRQVVFLTDGAVSNEREMLRLIERDLGRSRLFTVGIGAAPNSYFMTAAAEAGRGAHVFIGDLSEVQEKMQALFRRIETPAMTDLALEIEGAGADEAQVEIWPNPLPDLYAGDPVVATIRAPKDLAADARLRISGVRGATPWSETVALSSAEARPGVSKLWARQRIRALEAFRSSPDADAEALEQIDAEILGTALRHHLVSRLTSLVAVDVTPTRPEDEAVVTREVPLNLPQGWDAEAFFDEAPAAAEPAGPEEAALQTVPAAAVARLEEVAEIRTRAQAVGAPIPATSVDWWLKVAFGALLLLLGAALWRRSRRRAAASA